MCDSLDECVVLTGAELPSRVMLRGMVKSSCGPCVDFDSKCRKYPP